MTTSAFSQTFRFVVSSLTFVVCIALLPAFGQRPELYVQTGHSSWVQAVAYSPDGKTVASGSADEAIKLWDVTTGEELKTLIGHTSQIWKVAFSPDGKTLFSGSWDGSIRVWDVAQGVELRAFYPRSVSSVAFSSDGKLVATGGFDNTIRLWNMASGSELKTLTGHSEWVSSLAFSPDGKLLASGCVDNAVKLWDVTSGKELTTLNGHSSRVESVAFSPDGRTLASGGWDDTIRLWNIASGAMVKTLTGHSEWVQAVAFSPDGKTLASGSADNSVKLWDVTTGQNLTSLDGHSAGVFSLVYSPDGRTLASGSQDKTIILWAVPDGQKIKTLKGHSREVSQVEFSPDGKKIAIFDPLGGLRLWNLVSGEVLMAPSGPNCQFINIAFSPDGKTVAIGCAGDNTIRLWDLITGHERKTLTGHSEVIASIAFSPDGNLLASGSWDKTIRIWNVASGLKLRTLKGHLDRVESVVFSANGKSLASGSDDKTIKLWDVTSGQQIRTLSGHSEKILSLVFSSNGNLLVSGSEDASIKLWDVATGQVSNTIAGKSGRILSVAISPDGTTLASGGDDKNCKLWSLTSGKELKTLTGHSNSISSVAFSPDGSTLASGSADATTKIWDVGSGTNLASMISLDENDWVVVTQDGRFDGSPEGVRLIRYKQDNKLIPLDSYFEQFYYPHLLQQVYAREGTTNTTAGVDFSKRIELPPIVRITSPRPGSATNSDTAQIVVEATDQGGGVEDVRLYQNGKLVSTDTRQLTRETAAATRTYEVVLLPGVNLFRATAFNADRTESKPDEIRIELKAVEASSNLYILAIGLNDYKNTRYNLNYGHADAQAFAEAVESRGRGIFKQITKKVLFDSEATKVNILAAFAEIIKQAKPQDAFVFYYAGHGVMSEGDDKTAPDFYLVPYDVVRIFGDDGNLSAKGIAAHDLRETLRNIRALKQLIVLDACQSGGAVETIAMRGAAEEKAIMQLARSAGVAVFASAGQDQVSTEFSKLGHGVFTYALLKGLNGAADGSPMDGKITVKELEAYINDQVPELTKLYRGKRQDPNSSTRGQDFPIGIR